METLLAVSAGGAAPPRPTRPPRRIVVGVAEMAVASEPGAQLITHALGSCLGITVFDPVAGVGGLVHVMLPDSLIDPQKAKAHPCMFVDTGVPLLFQECYRAGAQKQRMEVRVAGGARALSESDHFQIGKRNFAMLRLLFQQNGVSMQAHDVGGNHSRTMVLDVATGQVTLRICGAASTL